MRRTAALVAGAWMWAWMSAWGLAAGGLSGGFAGPATAAEPDSGDAAAAEVARLRLCTAGRGGIYYFAGQSIAAEADPGLVRIEVLSTDGSFANVQGIADGTCDGAIVQSDAVFTFNEDNPDRRLRLAPLTYLHKEYVHLVCRRGSPVTEINDLADNPGGFRLLMGAIGSGSHVTWRSFTRLDPDYAPVLSVSTDREAIVDAMLQGRADCLIYVAGLGSQYMTAIEAHGDRFRLVPVDDGDFDDLELLGNKLYKFDFIPSSTYARLQVDTGNVETITIRALFIIAEDWARANAAAYAATTAAARAASTAIFARVGQTRDW